MRWLPTLLLLVALPAGAVPIYRWVDAQGQVHYSDRPVPGATEIDVQPAPGFPAPARSAASAEADSSAGEAAQQGSGYQTLAITSPAQQETLWNIGATLNVSLNLQPPLRPGNTLRLYMDDNLVQQLTAPAGQVTLNDVFRGVHVLRAEVVDAAGTVVIESSPVTFMVQQTSVLNPNRGPNGSLPKPP